MTTAQLYHRLNMPSEASVMRVRAAFHVALMVGLLLLAFHSTRIDGCARARELAMIVLLRGMIIMFIAACGEWSFQRLRFHAGRVRHGDKSTA